MENAIIVIVEHFEDKVRPVTNELLAYAIKLQMITKAAIKLVVLGDNIDNLATELAETTGMDVEAVQVPNLKLYNPEVYKTVLADLLSEIDFSCCCIANSTQGLDFAPGLAVRLSAGCITGVVKISEKEELPIFTRAISGGKVVADMQSRAETLITTIQPGSFKPVTFDSPTPGKINTRTVSCVPEKSKNLEIKPAEDDNSALSEASVVVAAGRGIGKEENLKNVYQLSELFARSIVGGSRPLCDLDWLKYNQQVGVTGATVTPDLYLACGISGASQHISGMQGSGFIVSINLDPTATIFNLSDICVVEDLNTFIPVFIKEYQKMKDS